MFRRILDSTGWKGACFKSVTFLIVPLLYALPLLIRLNFRYEGSLVSDVLAARFFPPSSPPYLPPPGAKKYLILSRREQ